VAETTTTLIEDHYRLDEIQPIMTVIGLTTTSMMADPVTTAEVDLQVAIAPQVEDAQAKRL
jgi:hypothetical protein